MFTTCDDEKVVCLYCDKTGSHYCKARTQRPADPYDAINIAVKDLKNAAQELAEIYFEGRIPYGEFHDLNKKLSRAFDQRIAEIADHPEAFN